MAKSTKQQALEFINSGISCNCLVLLKEVGVLDFLVRGNSIGFDDISKFCPNGIAVHSAFITLEKAGVMERSFNKYSLTKLGYALADYSGLITMLFDGYGLLMAEQKRIARGQIKLPSKLMRCDSIADSSIHFGQETVDPLVAKVFDRIYKWNNL